MTVSVTPTVNSSLANGVTTVFPYAFRILAAADLEVSVDSVVKTLGVDYTVSGVGSGSGGNVTFGAAPANGATVIRRRDMALVRTTDYQDNGDLLADVLNPDQDAPVMMLQQVQEEIDRSLKFPLGETASTMLPPVAQRAGMSLAFDASGNAIAGQAIGTLQAALDQADADAAAAHADRLAADADAAAALASRNAASASETNAATSATSALNSLTAALSAGHIYADTTTGLASSSGTGSTNRYFVVPGTGNDYMILYLNNAGTAVEQGRFPTTIGVQLNAQYATRSTDKDTALNSGTWLVEYFKPSTVGVFSSGTTGEFWRGFDAGADIPANTAIHAAVISLSVDATTQKVQVRLWEVNTTDGNVDAAPPQANDSLVSDVTFTSLSALAAFDGSGTGLTLNTNEHEYVFPFAAPVITKAGKTYKMSVRTLDGSSVPLTVNVGFRVVSGETRQRAAGARRSTPSGAFSNLGLTTCLAMGIVQQVFNSTSSMQTGIAGLQTSKNGMSQTRMRLQSNRNHERLMVHSLFYPKALADAVTNTGDSIVRGFGATTPATGSASALAAPYYTATTNDLGADGTRSDQIRTAFAALAGSQQNDYGFTNGGTNDQNQTASGVPALTITAAGASGTPGTYALAFSGGAGSSPTAPVGTFTVDGTGGVVSTSITNPGGGYTTLPTVSTAACPGLAGATLTPSFDIASTIVANLSAVAALSANRLLMGPWIGTVLSGALRRACASLKATYGGRFFDALPFLMRFHSGGAAELLSATKGVIPPSISADGLHPNDAGYNVLGREWALMIRASAGVGAPYIHDDVVGCPDTAAATAWTPRVLGTVLRYAIVDGNDDRAFDINATTGVITRASTGTMPRVAEMFVQAESALGQSNVARVVIGRKETATQPTRGVRMSASGGPILMADHLSGTAAKKLTFVLCARINNPTSDSVFVANWRTSGLVQVLKNGRAFKISATNSAGTLILNGPTTPSPQDLSGYNFYFFSVDTTTGVQIAKCTANEETAVTAVPNADETFDLSQLVTLFYTSALGTAHDIDVKMLWVAQDWIDAGDSTKRALFYDPTTRAPKDLGASGIVNGVTPLIYLQGYAGDYMTGNNRGSGGALHAVPYINAATPAFVDLDS